MKGGILALMSFLMDWREDAAASIDALPVIPRTPRKATSPNLQPQLINRPSRTFAELRGKPGRFAAIVIFPYLRLVICCISMLWTCAGRAEPSEFNFSEDPTSIFNPHDDREHLGTDENTAPFAFADIGNAAADIDDLTHRLVSTGAITSDEGSRRDSAGSDGEPRFPLPGADADGGVPFHDDDGASVSPAGNPALFFKLQLERLSFDPADDGFAGWPRRRDFDNAPGSPWVSGAADDADPSFENLRPSWGFDFVNARDDNFAPLTEYFAADRASPVADGPDNAIPEPSALLLMLTGLLSAAGAHALRGLPR